MGHEERKRGVKGKEANRSQVLILFLYKKGFD
jgi:hypothetical protein